MIQGTFSGTGGRQLAYRVWQPEAAPKAVVVIVHGYTEHGGRYHRFAEFLTGQGYLVYAHDHAGHGLSEGVRAHISAFETYVDDLRLFFDIVRNKNGALPLFLFGQSMGGAVGLLFTARYGECLNGAVFSAPALIVALKVSPLLKFISKILSALMPKMKVNKGIAEHLSRDPAVIEDYIQDPLVYSGKNRARLGYLLLQLEKVIPPVLPEITLPVCILQGTEDKIIDPKGARIIYEGISSEDKTLKWYNALYHELLHEPEKQEVMQFILQWLDNRISPE